VVLSSRVGKEKVPDPGQRSLEGTGGVLQTTMRQGKKQALGKGIIVLEKETGGMVSAARRARRG